MRETRLPAELKRLERLLSHGTRPGPSMALRQRVLDDVRAELRQQVLDDTRSELHREESQSRWHLALAIAMTLLVAVGVSLGAGHLAGSALQQRDLAPTLAHITWQIQQISPHVSQTDSEHLAKLRQIGDEASCGTAVNTLLAEFKLQ